MRRRCNATFVSDRPMPRGPTRRAFMTTAAAAVAAGTGWGARAEESGGLARLVSEASGPLADYVRRADPATRFKTVGWGETCRGQWVTGLLTSQVWQGTEWTHELSLFVPTDSLDRGPMLLWIDGGGRGRLPEEGQWEPTDSLQMLAPVAIAAGLPAAVVRQVPFQPMFDGLVEDSLIAHSFVQFVRTGDITWPLLLPMVKSAVEAMNVAERVAGSRWGVSVEGFVATGASKRGWTTWLAAAVDDRISGLVPAVIDMLSMEQHVGLQRESFGGFSDRLVDYTSRGIDRLFGTPRGRELIGIVDPLAYRDRLVQPKVIALGTNDPYWPLEACGLYYDKLEGPRWVSYCPNAGHGLPPERLGGLVAATGRHAAGLEDLPEVPWSVELEGDARVCRVAPMTDAVEKALAWLAHSPSRDFRTAEWKAVAAEREGGGWRLALAKPASGFTAGFIELSFERKPLPLVLTTGVAVVGTT